jgi:hypothetical protein
MLNTPWETGSALYRKLVVSALIISGAGVLMVLIGALTDAPLLMYIAVPVIVVGMCLHLGGMVVRARDTRRRMKGSK